MSQQAYHLKTDKWITVYKHLGLSPKRVTIRLSSTKPTDWRRIGLYLGWGSFHNKGQVTVFWGVLQLKNYENRTCTVTPEGEEPVYDEVTRETIHETLKEKRRVRKSKKDLYMYALISGSSLLVQAL